MKQLSLNLPTITMTNNFSSELSRIVKNKRCVIFTSKFWSNNDLLNAFKKNINILDIIDDIEPNPKLNGVFKKHLNIDDVDYIVSLGGGSVIDFTKAVIAFNGSNRNKEYFKETISLNKKFDLKNIPKIIAIPTTSGTGSELNSWGTIWEGEKKYSVSGDKLLPEIVVLDKNLCISMPRSLTVSSGLDALSHAFESIWNINNNPIVDEIAKIAIKKIKKNLPLVLNSPKNLEYRKEMQTAALFAGIAMSKTKTAICHSISYPLTSLYGLSHGIACSLTLSEVSRLLLQKNESRCYVLSEAMGCDNLNLENSIIDFFKLLNYGKYLDAIENIQIDKSINFINPARAKNSLVQVTNSEAINIINSAIAKLI
tara:strand:- start:714 stop:1820 length:1107 start_codon:yes stop_codon:yes gene_type:complete